ncbi:NADH dehydrogenase [Orchesella cincta]|uniref:NADH dehydrogenase n=1 Tax=Orchesella cincta TaxID=48709 RepID=A0A1D2NEY3_ORCCI|nr:NADH dehydrogenase [Orchesella cincta]
MSKSAKLHKFVVVGGGAGGLELVTTLGRKLGKHRKAKVYLVDGSPTHIWKPLLHEVATGALNVGEDELNYFTHAYSFGYRFHFGFMKGIDRNRKVIISDKIKDLEGNIISGPRELRYDTLVLAVGGKTNSFGTPGVEEFCQRLDNPIGAEKLRRRFLGQAIGVALGRDPKIRIGIVGAGATGVELASEIFHTMTEIRAYGAKITADQLKITIMEAAPTVLAGVGEHVSAFAHQELTKKGIDIKTHCMIEKVTEKGFILGDGSLLETDIKIWTAGIKAHDWLSTLGLKTDRTNRLQVNEYLQTEDPSIYAFGDCAFAPNIKEPGKTLPASAQCAHQQAEWLAKRLMNDLKGKSTKPFVFNSQGQLVSLGNSTAVGTVNGLVSKVSLKGKSAKIVYSTLYPAQNDDCNQFMRDFHRRGPNVVGRLELPTDDLYPKYKLKIGFSSPIRQMAFRQLRAKDSGTHKEFIIDPMEMQRNGKLLLDVQIRLHRAFGPTSRVTRIVYNNLALCGDPVDASDFDFFLSTSTSTSTLTPFIRPTNITKIKDVGEDEDDIF